MLHGLLINIYSYLSTIPGCKNKGCVIQGKNVVLAILFGEEIKKRQACKPGSVFRISGTPVIYPGAGSHLPSNDLPSGIGRATLKPRYIWSFNA